MGLFHRNQFVTRSQNRHARPPEDLEGHTTASRSQRDLCKRNRGSGWKQFVALSSLRSLFNQVLAALQLARWEQPNLSVRDFDMLHHRYRVGAFRNSGAGHNFAGSTRCKGLGRRVPGAERSGNPQEFMRGSLTRTASKSIPRRTREWRLVSIGGEGLGKHPAECRIQIHALD